MKKILAPLICLMLLATPCFAMDRHHGPKHHPVHRPPVHHQVHVTYHQPVYHPPVRHTVVHHHSYHHRHHHVSDVTKGLAVATGVFGLAAIISSVVD